MPELSADAVFQQLRETTPSLLCPALCGAHKFVWKADSSAHMS